MRKFLLSLLSLLPVFFASAANHTLFDNGRSAYTIVLSAEASESEKFAAEELQYWINEVGSVKIPIAGIDGGKKGRRIIVGYNPLVRSLLGVLEPPYADEAFTYTDVRGDILIWGGAKRGTLYGVYGFLENELGCRWYSSKVSVAPKRKSWTFSNLYDSEKPGIAVRNVFYMDSFDPLWSVRNRSNASMSGFNSGRYGGTESFWGGHTFNRFVDPDIYFESHPEYFSEIDGKRTRERSQLCLSNPDVLKIMIESVRKEMRSNPEHLIYSVGQNDWEGQCCCERCNAIKKQFGNTESGLLIWFVNQVADAVKEEFPDKYIGTFAYMYTRQAPGNIRPRDNVVVRLCSIEACQLHGMTDPCCPENYSFSRDLEAWSAIAPHLYIWDYVATFPQYLAPMPNVWTFQDRIKCFRDNNALGIMPQGNYQSLGTTFDEMKAYVIGKLMWNPDCDVNAVIDDFLNGFFGAAGPVVREYIEYERQALARPGLHESCFPMLEDNKLYSEEFVDAGREIFKRAYAAVEGQTEYVERLERAELALCYLQMVFDPRAGYDQGAWELFNRVVRRDGISHLCEWGWYQTFSSFDKEKSICMYIDHDSRDAGDIKFEGTDIWLHFKKALIESAVPGTPEEQMVGANLVSQFIRGWNGQAPLYLYVYPWAGGNELANYHFGGTVVPGEDYVAVCDGNWINETVTFEGFDPGYDYVIVVKDLNPAELTFRFVKIRPGN